MKKLTQQSSENPILSLLSLLSKVYDTGGKILFDIYESEENTYTYHYVFVIPIHSILYMQSKVFSKAVFLDTTFLNIEIRGHFVEIVCVTPNNTYLTVGFGWCPSENHLYIKKFLELFKHECEITSFMKDESQSIQKAIEIVFPESDTALCSYHLGKRYPAIIYTLLKCETKTEFDTRLSQLMKCEGFPHHKLDSFKRTSRFYHPINALGHRTNNASEAQNAFLKLKNFANLTEIFDAFLKRSSNTIIDLAENSSEEHLYVSYVITKLEKYDKLISDNKLHVQNAQELKHNQYKSDIVVYDHDKLFIVKRNKKMLDCICEKMKERHFPCKHVYCVIKSYPRMFNLNEYIDQCYWLSNIRELIASIEAIEDANDKSLDFHGNSLTNPVEFVKKQEKRKEAF